MAERSTFGVILLIAAVLFGVYTTHEAGLNQKAPAFSLPDGYGGRLDLAFYSGRPVLLVFWTTWCGICQRELPMLSQLQPELASKGIAVVAIHLGGQAEADAYMRSNRIYLTSVSDAEGNVGRAYRVSGVPALVLIGKDGKIKRSASGWTDTDVLRNWIDSVSGS